MLPVTRLTQLLGIGGIVVQGGDSAIGVRDVAVQPVGHRPVEEILEPNGEMYSNILNKIV